MMRRRVCAVCAAAIVLAAASARVRGADRRDPRELLAALPATTNLTVLALDGAIRKTYGVERWRVFVNDALVFESPAAAGKSEIPLGLGLILRTGDNLIALEAFGADDDTWPLERWTTHVHRHQAGEGEVHQFAVLAQGELGAGVNRRHVDTFRRALIANGVPERNIHTVASWEGLADTLSEIGKETGVRDQVLVYFSGLGRVSRANAEPELLFQKSEPTAVTSLPAGNLIREAEELPSVSVLLDIVYAPALMRAFAAPRIEQESLPSTAAPWLRTISSTSNVELAYTNPFPAALRATTDGFTNDFVGAISAPASADACRTFAGVAQSVAAQNSQTRAAWPVYYARTPSSFRFCPPQSAAGRPALAISAVPPTDASPLQFVDVRIPPAASTPAAPPELTVDGVPVRTVATDLKDATSQRLPVGPGEHVIEVMAGGAGTHRSSVTGVSGTAAPAASDLHWSGKLTAEIQPAAIPSMTSETSVALPFIVGDRENRPVRYEVRNNGVVVLQDVVKAPSQLLRQQTVRRIPLTPGTNHLALDVVRDGGFASARARIERRRAQPVRAVIVGVDAPPGAKPLTGAVADALRMNDLLLRYSDAVPGRIRLLTGAGATRKAVFDAIVELSRRADGPDDTFLLYIAGYGLTIDDPAAGAVTRCILMSDFDPDRERATCVSTADLDAALDAVGRALVIVDTSYDGLAGERSRTYRTYRSADAGWRLTSGTDRPDRAFLVASANAAALESDDGGGFFTLALEKAIRGRLDAPAAKGPQELSLLEAYERAREETSARSERRQVPVMKGVLSAPFAFVRKPVDELKQEAAGIERAARNDLTSMRRLDPDRLTRAKLLYEKVLTLDREDIDARQGRARALMLAGDLDAARQAVDEAVQPDSRAPADVDWLPIRAELKMRAGDLQGAIADAERANSPGRPATAALLGMLYGVTGQPRKSLEILQPLLEHDPPRDGSLTDEDLGRILLHTYLSLRRSSGWSNASVLLESFTNTYRGKGWLLKATYQNPVMQKLFPVHTRSIQMGQVGVQAPWSYLVAQLFRKNRKYEQALTSFQKDAEAFDPRDGAAFECLLHFYVGMARAFDGAFVPAIVELQKAVNTGKTEYVEYWFARQEIARFATR